MEGRQQLFLTTRWTLMDHVKQPDAVESLDELCRTYWGPVVFYLRRCGCLEDDAQDLAQDFFRDFLARDGFARAKREKGRFRSFLLTSVRNHLSNSRKASQRLKRGGGVTFSELHEDLDVGDGLTPEEAFDKRWAEDLIDRALVRLRSEWEEKDRPFAVLSPYLSGERGAPPLGETADKLGVSLAAAKSAVHRLRKRLGELVREEVGATVGERADEGEELEHLLQLLSK